MKNPSFGALHNPLPSQSEMQGGKPNEKIQQQAVSHGCAKPLEVARGFRTPCQISHGMQNFPMHRLH